MRFEKRIRKLENKVAGIEGKLNILIGLNSITILMATVLAAVQ